MESLYKELLERLKHLEEEREQTPIIQGRIAEINLVIIRIQQILLDKISPY